MKHDILKQSFLEEVMGLIDEFQYHGWKVTGSLKKDKFDLGKSTTTLSIFFIGELQYLRNGVVCPIKVTLLYFIIWQS